jgi:Mg-chelatase subunit ChlI
MNRDERRVSMIQMLLSAEYDKIDKENAALKAEISGAEARLRDLWRAISAYETITGVKRDDILSHADPKDDSKMTFSTFDEYEEQIGELEEEILDLTEKEEEKKREQREKKKKKKETPSVDELEKIQRHFTELEESGAMSGDDASDAFSNYLDGFGLDGDDYMEMLEDTPREAARRRQVPP